MRGASLLGMLLLLTVCGGEPWHASGAPQTPPDDAYRTGYESGHDVWIWHCLDGARVMVRRTSSAWLPNGTPEIIRGPCGDLLPQEQADAGRHTGVPPTWPGSGGVTP